MDKSTSITMSWWNMETNVPDIITKIENFTETLL